MKIFYKLSDNYNPNYVDKHADNSFGSDEVYFDFQVSLTSNRSFILNFDIYSKKCVSCEGYLLIDKKTKNENIVIEKFSNGELLIELEDFEKEARNKINCRVEICVIAREYYKSGERNNNLLEWRKLTENMDEFVEIRNIEFE